MVPLFDSSSKNASNDKPQPSNDTRKKNDDSKIDNQERPKKINTTLLEDTHADFFGDETEVDMSNISTTYPVSSSPNTRIHKDRSLAQENKPKKARWLYRVNFKENGIDYDEVFAPVARIEAIRLFLAYASFKDFVVYQMDVKSTFLYGKIEKEVYVYQPLGFEASPHNGFQKRGQYDKTLFIKKIKGDILLVQVYVDDIIFGSTKKVLCTEFEKLMHKKFQMSSMGELTFFLGLQVTQKDDGIFISQDKYVEEILKKFGFSTVKTASTPMETSKPLLKDAEAEDVDVHLYKSMIGSLMYLTASRPDIMFVVCACARFQVTPKAYTDSDYAECKFWTGNPQQSSGPIPLEIDETVIKEYEDRMERAATTTSSLDESRKCLKLNCASLRNAVRLNLQLPVLVYAARHTLTAVRHKLMLPGITCYCWLWALTKAKIVNGERKIRQIQALVDKKKVIIFETSIRSDLKLDDAEGTYCLPTATIFAELERMGLHLGMNLVALRHLQSYALPQTKNSTFPIFLEKQVEGMSKHKGVYVTPSHTKKVFANMKRPCKGFSGRVTPLFSTMMVQATEDMGEDLAAPSDSYSTPIISQPSSSKPQKKKSRRKQRKDSSLTELVPDEAYVSTPSYDLPQRGGCIKKQGRKIADLDADEEVTLVDETQEMNDDNLMFVTTAGEVVTTANVEVTTVNAPTTTIDVVFSLSGIMISGVEAALNTCSNCMDVRRDWGYRELVMYREYRLMMRVEKDLQAKHFSKTSSNKYQKL
ncbi:putative ribonuclease H-like domain-containing protein [Tanacetum coccineum]